MKKFLIAFFIFLSISMKANALLLPFGSYIGLRGSTSTQNRKGTKRFFKNNSKRYVWNKDV